MPVPSEIIALVNQLNQELNSLEQEATEGLNLLRPILSRFPENTRLIQFLAFLSNALFSAINYRDRIQSTVEDISPADTTDEEI